MSTGTVRSAAVYVAFATGVSLLSILQVDDWARVSTPARHYFSTYITTTDQYQDSVSEISWASLSSQLGVKFRTLTYIKSCGYVGVSGHSSTQY